MKVSIGLLFLIACVAYGQAQAPQPNSQEPTRTRGIFGNIAGAIANKVKTGFQKIGSLIPGFRPRPATSAPTTAAPVTTAAPSRAAPASG